MSAEVFNFTATTTAVHRLSATGSFVYYLSGSAGGKDARIRVKNQVSGVEMDMYPGQAFELPAGQKSGTEWVVENIARQATIYGELVIGDGRFYDNRLIGDLSAVDSDLLRVQRSECFFGSAEAGAVGDYGGILLAGPTVTGRVSVVERVVITADEAQKITIVPNCPVFNDAGDISKSWSNSANKSVGSALSSGAIYKTDKGSIYAWPTSNAQVRVAPGVPYVMDLKKPFYVGKAFSIAFKGSSVSATNRFAVYFDFYETTVP